MVHPQRSIDVPTRASHTAVQGPRGTSPSTLSNNFVMSPAMQYQTQLQMMHMQHQMHMNSMQMQSRGGGGNALHLPGFKLLGGAASPTVGNHLALEAGGGGGGCGGFGGDGVVNCFGGSGLSDKSQGGSRESLEPPKEAASATSEVAAPSPAKGGVKGLDLILAGAVHADTPKAMKAKSATSAKKGTVKGKGKESKAKSMTESHKKAITLNLSHLLVAKVAKEKKRETFGCICYSYAKSKVAGKPIAVQKATMSWARFQAVSFWDKHN